MICYRCKKQFDEKLGNTCPYCLTLHKIKYGSSSDPDDYRVIDVILTEKCTNCGGEYHKSPSFLSLKATCIKCGNIDNIGVKPREDKNLYLVKHEPYAEKISRFKLKKKTNFKCPECSKFLYNTKLDGIYYYCPKCKKQYPV